MLAVAGFVGANTFKRWELILSQGGDAYGWPSPFYFEAGMKERFWRFDLVSLVFDIFFWLLLCHIAMYGYGLLQRFRHVRFRLSTFDKLMAGYGLVATGVFIWANLRTVNGYPRGWPGPLLYFDGFSEGGLSYFHLVTNIAVGIVLLYLSGRGLAFLAGFFAPEICARGRIFSPTGSSKVPPSQETHGNRNDK